MIPSLFFCIEWPIGSFMIPRVYLDLVVALNGRSPILCFQVCLHLIVSLKGRSPTLFFRVAFIYSIAGCTRGTHPKTNCAVIRSHQPCLARARCNRGVISHTQKECGCAQSLGPLRGRSLRKIEKHNYVPSGAAHIRKLRRDRWISQEAFAHTA